MASIVTEFVGPRPGCFIMKFCQGVTEMVARSITLVLSVGVLITSAISLGFIGTLPPSADRSFDGIVFTATGFRAVTLVVNSQCAGGVGVGVAVLILIWEIIMIILRFLNIGLLNLKSKIFLGIDVAVGLVLAIVVNISGILAAYITNEWTRTIQQNNPATPSSVTQVRDSLIALAAIGLLEGLLLALLATWMIVFILRKWNEQVVKETVKDAI